MKDGKQKEPVKHHQGALYLKQEKRMLVSIAPDLIAVG